MWPLLFFTAAGLCVFVLAAGIYFFRFALLRHEPPDYAKKAKMKNTPVARYGDRIAACARAFDEMPFERIEIKSFDGLRLCGKYFAAENARATLVLMHGYHSAAGIDFGCAVPFLLREMRFNLLFAEQRTHGESEGEYITFGVKERYDCRDWALYAAQKAQDLPILLYGLSMGAATVLMASGLDLPRQVAGIIADCGFTTPRAIFRHVLVHGLHLPVFPLLPLVAWFCRRFADFSVDGASTLEALAKNTRPVLLIHGEEDTFVPTYMSLQNYEACQSEKMLLTVKGAAHGLSYLVAEEACRAKITAFFELCLREYHAQAENLCG